MPVARRLTVVAIVGALAVGVVAASRVFGPSRATLIAALATAVGLVYLITLWPAWPVNRWVVNAFPARHRLVVTTAGGPLVLRYLSGGRLWRRWFALAGFVIGVGWTEVASTTALSTGWFFTAAGGYFLGAIAAEARAAGRPAASGARAASLVPRRRRHYLHPARIRAAYLYAGCAVSLVVAVAVWPDADPRMALGGRLAIAVGALACSALLDVITRRVALRPQRRGSRDVVAADDAIHANSAHLLAGAALSFLAWEFFATSAISGGVTDGLLEAAGWVCLAGSVLTWFSQWRGPWVVRRPVLEAGRSG